MKKDYYRLIWLFGFLTILLIVVSILNPSLVRLAGAALNIPVVSCADITEIPVQECQALETLYQNTNGENWGIHTGWFTTATPCIWFGVGCSEGHVVSVILNNNQLSGNLPDISDLSELQRLSLSRNYLSGSLLSDLSQLGNLEELILSYNQFSGPIPAAYGELSNLKKLHLQANLLSGSIPGQLGNLEQLEELFLHYNQLDNGIPAALGDLLELRKLRLQHNQLVDDIPAALGQLALLEEMDLSSNLLTGNLPDQLGSLGLLQKLYLSNNLLTGGIPASFADLDALVELNLMNNQLSGSIPPALGELDNLIYLNLSTNQFSGALPELLGDLVNLQKLILSSNQLDGSIPIALGSLSALKTLDVSQNAFLGEIPPSLASIFEAGLGLSDYVSFGYNRLEADDPTLVEYLNVNDPYWQVTQTVPPENLTVRQVSIDSLELSWMPIPYTENGGYYEISYAMVSEGAFIIHGFTQDKTISSYQISNLLPEMQYYLRIRTFTPAHEGQVNELWSEYTPTLLIAMATELPQQSFIYLPLLRR